MDGGSDLVSALGVLVPLSMVAAIAAVIILPGYFRSRDRARMHETIRLAYEKGQPVPPELIEALQTGGGRAVETPQTRAARDLRGGIIWLAIGLGILAIGGVSYASLYNVGGAVEALCTAAGFAAIPIFIGLAFLILSALGRNKRS